jgi:hypothetical protein
MEREMLERWKRAVIPLECAGDSEDSREHWRQVREENKLLSLGKITHEQFLKTFTRSRKSHDRRFGGTALFLAHEGRRYLLTARHVLWDDLEAKRAIDDANREAHPFLREASLRSATEQASNQIFGVIFRCRSLGETVSSIRPPAFLMNLGAGGPEVQQYTFSDELLDLALISLDVRNGQFADELEGLGYAHCVGEHLGGSFMGRPRRFYRRVSGPACAD